MSHHNMINSDFYKTGDGTKQFLGDDIRGSIEETQTVNIPKYLCISSLRGSWKVLAEISIPNIPGNRLYTYSR